MKAQLAIIGGGLAGLSLAILEAKAGQQVLLFEKKSYPAHKVCGEYISLESWRFLEALGVPLVQWDLPILKRLQLSSPAKMIDLELDLGGFGVSRYKLEAEMLQLTKAAGVEVHAECEVRAVSAQAKGFLLQTEAGNFEVERAAGSWGRRSLLYKQAPQPHNFVGVKWHLKGEMPNDLIALHNFEGGYAGMSRIEDDLSCFCYLVSSERLKKAGSIPALEQAMRRENPFLEARLNTLEPVWNEPLTISQVSFSPKATSHQGVFLLGDAAGSIAPLAGNGMSMALHAAYLLHLQLEKVRNGQLTESQLVSAYDQAWKKQFKLRTAVSYRIQGLFGRNALTTPLLYSVGALPFLGKQLMKLTHGRDFMPLQT
ncbi:MAG: NAD(P)/FAD-dependent oxidoreductase [Sphingobacteriaceae bacterium]|nr:NAD(P)/FAD-dependent oxidoreductase [Sphingobacteriaceae bacterium]